MVIYNQPRPTQPCQIGPGPLHEDTQPETRLREKQNVYRRPSEPCQRALQSKISALQNAIALTDHCHRALVKVTKRTHRVFFSNAAMDQGSGVTPLLHGDLRYTR